MGQVIGEAYIKLPADYKEIIIEADRNNGTIRYTFNFSKEQLPSDVEVYYKHGCYISNTNYEGLVILMSKTQVRLYSWYDSGTNKVSSCAIRAHYR